MIKMTGREKSPRSPLGQMSFLAPLLRKDHFLERNVRKVQSRENIQRDGNYARKQK